MSSKKPATVTNQAAPKKVPAKAAAAKAPAAAAKAPAAAAAAAPVKEPPKIEIQTIKLKEIGQVFDDANDRQKTSNKWPLIVDTDSRVASFLRHRDLNYINCSDVETRSPEGLRRALIGAIRFNKPLALDIEDRDILWSEVKASFDQAQEGVLDDLVSKKLMENENFLKLVRIEIDGPEYKEFNFAKIGGFKLIVVTSNDNLPPAFLHNFTVYKIE